MTSPAGNLLRRVTLKDHCPLLHNQLGNGFILRNTKVKRMRSTNAPFHLFDVLDSQGTRLGVASLILEPSIDAVRDYGHVCVTLADDKSNSELLADVAQLVFNIAYSLGLKELRVVIPDDHAASVAACNALKPYTAVDCLDQKGKSFLAYHYKQA